MYKNALACLLLSSLFCASALGTEQITSTLLLKSDESWNGAALPAYPEGPAEISIYRISVPPGASFPPHQHPVITGAVIIAGELSVTTDDGQSIELVAGDALLEVVNTWHQGHNKGQVPTDIMVFYVGTPGQAVTKPWQE